MLARDRTVRMPPPVTLPGQPAAVVTIGISTVKYGPPGGLRHEHRGKPSAWAGGAEPQPGDELLPYSRQHLERMNMKFCRAMERAIASGAERDPRRRAVDDPIADLLAHLRGAA
jgi:hypothetical protein